MVLGFIVIGIGYAATLYFHGFGAFLDMVLPHRGHAIQNMILAVITLAPGYLLLQSAEAIERRQRKRAVVVLLLFPLAATLSVGLFWLGLRHPAARTEEVTTSPIAHVESLDGTIGCHWARDRLITVISGPCDSFSPPQHIRLGETFQANGKKKVINVIQASRIPKDFPDLGLKAGDVTCTAAESADNIPSGSRRSEHTGTWLYIPKCRIVE
jgi:hypothetical protein